MRLFLSKLILVLMWSLALVSGLIITQAVMPLIKPPTLSNLASPQKETLLVSLANAYAYNDSLPDAIAMMNDAGVTQPVHEISDLLIRLSESGELEDVERLSSLLVVLGGDVPAPVGTAIAITLTTPPTSQFTTTDVPVQATPETQNTLPTSTPWAALDYSLTIDNACVVSEVPVVEISVRDQSGFGIPGHTFELLIGDEIETVHTGLRVERDPGYLDFLLREGMVITLSPVSINGESLTFEVVPCVTETGEDGYINYMLTYVRLQETS